MKSIKTEVTEPPESGYLHHLRDGVHWVRMPLPFDLDHINLWMVEGKTGWTIIDAGINTPETKEYWQNVFDTALKDKPVNQLIITHFHPDHIGLAGWMERKYGLRPVIKQAEFDMIHRLFNVEAEEEILKTSHALYAMAGVSPDQADKFSSIYKSYRHVVEQPLSHTPLGDTIDIGDHTWQIISGYGHSPEHASLYSSDLNILICGDMVLPHISANISVTFDNPDEDCVGAYLDSLEEIKRRVPDDALILPSHNTPYVGLHRRVEELKQHHAKRLGRILEVLADTPQSSFAITEQLFSHRDLGTQDTQFALSEVIAHLNHLIKKGKVSVDRENTPYLYQKTNI